MNPGNRINIIGHFLLFLVYQEEPPLLHFVPVHQLQDSGVVIAVLDQEPAVLLDLFFVLFQLPSVDGEEGGLWDLVFGHQAVDHLAYVGALDDEDGMDLGEGSGDVLELGEERRVRDGGFQQVGDNGFLDWGQVQFLEKCTFSLRFQQTEFLTYVLWQHLYLYKLLSQIFLILFSHTLFENTPDLLELLCILRQGIEREQQNNLLLVLLLGRIQNPHVHLPDQFLNESILIKVSQDLHEYLPELLEGVHRLILLQHNLSQIGCLLDYPVMLVEDEVELPYLLLKLRDLLFSLFLLELDVGVLLDDLCDIMGIDVQGLDHAHQQVFLLLEPGFVGDTVTDGLRALVLLLSEDCVLELEAESFVDMIPLHVETDHWAIDVHLLGDLGGAIGVQDEEFEIVRVLQLNIPDHHHIILFSRFVDDLGQQWSQVLFEVLQQYGCPLLNGSLDQLRTLSLIRVHYPQILIMQLQEIVEQSIRIQQIRHPW